MLTKDLVYLSSIFIQFIWCYIYQFPFMFFSQYVFLLCRKTIYDMVGEQGITLTRTLVLAVALMALGTVHKWRHNFNFWPRANWKPFHVVQDFRPWDKWTKVRYFGMLHFQFWGPWDTHTPCLSQLVFWNIHFGIHFKLE